MDKANLWTPEQIERRAKRAGVDMGIICRRAGVARSVFTRWKNGTYEPHLDNYRRLVLAVKEARVNDVRAPVGQ